MGKCNLNNLFGGDDTYETDISIEDDSDVNRHSYSDFGHSYKHSDYPEKTNKANTVLAGSNYFKTVEIEVFAKEYWSPVFLFNFIIPNLASFNKLKETTLFLIWFGAFIALTK